jgi:hypothetical protein
MQVATLFSGDESIACIYQQFPFWDEYTGNHKDMPVRNTCIQCNNSHQQGQYPPQFQMLRLPDKPVYMATWRNGYTFWEQKTI